MNIRIIESYVGKGAPSNVAGPRVGYGYTRAQAHNAADHWNNQAPFARTRTVTVCNYLKAEPYTRDCEIAWRIVGGEAGLEFNSWGEEVRELLASGKYASAVSLVLQARTVDQRTKKQTANFGFPSK